MIARPAGSAELARGATPAVPASVTGTARAPGPASTAARATAPSPALGCTDTPSATRPSRAAVVAAFAAIYMFWGGTFLAIRYAVADVPPLLTIAVRCLGGAALLYVWLIHRGGLERVTPDQWLTSTIAGVFLFVGCHGVLASAEQRVSSGQAALFMTTIPLWLVLLTSVRERRAPSRMVVAGLVLGILGVALLAGGNGAWSGTLVDRLAL